MTPTPTSMTSRGASAATFTAIDTAAKATPETPEDAHILVCDAAHLVQHMANTALAITYHRDRTWIHPR